MLPVLLYIPASFWKGWVVTAPCVLTIAEAFSGEAVSIGTLVDTLIPTAITVVVCYELSYWPARSIVGHPAGAQAYCCQWVLLHGRLTPMLHWLHVSAVDDIIYGPQCGTHTKEFLVLTHVLLSQSPHIGIWLCFETQAMLAYSFWSWTIFAQVVRAVSDGYFKIFRGIAARL